MTEILFESSLGREIAQQRDIKSEEMFIKAIIAMFNKIFG